MSQVVEFGKEIKTVTRYFDSVTNLCHLKASFNTNSKDLLGTTYVSDCIV